MEKNKSDKKIGVFLYELLGTAFIMYAAILSKGEYSKTVVFMTFIMMILAWDLTGGHFNPVISVSVYVAEGKFGKNLVPLLIMVGAQFAGAFLGVLFGYLAVIDKTY